MSSTTAFPRQLLFVHTGQCGIQMGSQFWQLALAEHTEELRRPMGHKDHNYGSIYQEFSDNSLQARAIVLDTEPGVVNSLLNSKIGQLFAPLELHGLMDASGSGNNWTTGYFHYGQKHRDLIEDLVRYQLRDCEHCDSLVSTNSISGGTGSGLGSAVLELLSELCPKMNVLSAAVFPSYDDVVVAPYNAVLTAAHLAEYSSVVIPFHNSAIINCMQNGFKKSNSDSFNRHHAKTVSRNAYQTINSAIANVLLDVTASIRFGGPQVVLPSDTRSLVAATPGCNILLPATAPWAPISKDVRVHARTFEKMFTDIDLPSHLLVDADPRTHTTVAQGYFARNATATMDQVNKTLDRKIGAKKQAGRQKSFLGLCNVPRQDEPFSVTGLTNSSATTSILADMIKKFNALLCRRAHIHHYSSDVGLDDFNDTVELLKTQISAYKFKE